MIIAITGVKRSGKDTAAEYLATHYIAPDPSDRNESYWAEVVTFRQLQICRISDPLKRALETIYGWDRSVWDTDEKEVVDPYWGISPRQAAQILGTEWSIMLSTRFPDYEQQTGRKTYIKSFVAKATMYALSSYIVPDMRFEYESEAIRNMGGLTLRIRRPEVETHIDSHASEQEVLSLYADTEIVNDGTLEEFYESLDIYAKAIGLTSIL
jgi:hypothetical protein